MNSHIVTSCCKAAKEVSKMSAEIYEKTGNVEKVAGAKQSIQIGPEVICDDVNTIHTNDLFTCCKCTKKVDSKIEMTKCKYIIQN